MLIGGGGGAPLLPPLVWSGDDARFGYECRVDDGGGGGFRNMSFVAEGGGAGGSLLGGGGGRCDCGVDGADLQKIIKRRLPNLLM